VPVECGVRRLDGDDATDGIAALQRALGAPVDLHLLHVPDAAVDIDRLVEGQRAPVDLEIDARPGARKERIGADGRPAAVDAANGRGVVGRAVGDEIGDEAQKIVSAVGAGRFLHILARHHGDARLPYRAGSGWSSRP
jgi:hypothetical protein